MGGFGWIKALGKGAAGVATGPAGRIAAKFVPGLAQAVAAVETIKALKGKNVEREDKAIAIAQAGVALTEAVAGDVLNDAAVIEATRRVIRLEVAAEKLVAQAKAIQDHLDEARADLAILIAQFPQLKNRPPES